MLIINLQSSRFISDGESRTRYSKCVYHAIVRPTDSPVQSGLIRSRALCSFQGGETQSLGHNETNKIYFLSD